jgi:acyl carrier protein
MQDKERLDNMSDNDFTYLTERVQNLLVEALQVSPGMVTPELAFGDVPQWDSLGHMDIMLRLEEQFGVDINGDTIAQLISVPEICRYIQENGHDQ